MAAIEGLGYRSIGRLLAEADDLPPLLSVEEAGALAGLSRSAAYRAVERGELPTISLAGRLRVPVSALLQLMGIVGAPTPPAEAPGETVVHTESGLSPAAPTRRATIDAVQLRLVDGG